MRSCSTRSTRWSRSCRSRCRAASSVHPTFRKAVTRVAVFTEAKLAHLLLAVCFREYYTPSTVLGVSLFLAAQTVSHRPDDSVAAGFEGTSTNRTSDGRLI